jgi:hypothetical protein
MPIYRTFMQLIIEQRVPGQRCLFGHEFSPHLSPATG